jgi:hypothetical protein
MTRRRVVTVGAVAAVLAVVGTGIAIGRGDGAGASGNGSGTTGNQHEMTTARVSVKDLAETQDVQGTLGYGDSRDVSFAGHGTITALAAVGTTVARGGRLGEVNGSPVTLFYGDRPEWRDLQAGVSDGADIEQLEANLIALGYGTRHRLGPNRQWNNETTDAVKRWQHALGVAETGVVTMTDVVYLPGPVRIAAQPGASGEGGGAALKVTGTTRIVGVDLDAQYQALVHKGQVVQVELPSGAMTPATITSVGTVASTGQQGQNPTIPVVAQLQDQSAGANLDEAPVTVHIATTEASGVLAVPVGALLALSEGGYAVEKVTGQGTTALIGVHLGVFADGWVQVNGDVKSGDVVVVAQ